jgi:GxxExxY protein
MIQFKELSQKEEQIGKAIVNAAYNIHKEPGSGLLEKVYEVCMAHELKKIGYDEKRQIDILIVYVESCLGSSDHKSLKAYWTKSGLSY